MLGAVHGAVIDRINSISAGRLIKGGHPMLDLRRANHQSAIVGESAKRAFTIMMLRVFTFS